MCMVPKGRYWMFTVRRILYDYCIPPPQVSGSLGGFCDFLCLGYCISLCMVYGSLGDAVSGLYLQLLVQNYHSQASKRERATLHGALQEARGRRNVRITVARSYDSSGITAH